jgi:aflatoxin B1 aldehyde reductase
LTKSKQQIEEGVGRFSADRLGGMYRRLYGRPAYLEALTQWAKVAEEEGVSGAELAYRWVSFHTPLSSERGDAIIFGASSLQQVKQTTAYIQSKPLSDKAVKGIEEVWKKIEHEAPLDNYHDGR